MAVEVQIVRLLRYRRQRSAWLLVSSRDVRSRSSSAVPRCLKAPKATTLSSINLWIQMLHLEAR